MTIMKRTSPYIDWISAKDRPRVSGTQIIVKTAIRTLNYGEKKRILRSQDPNNLMRANMAQVADGLANEMEYMIEI